MKAALLTGSRQITLSDVPKPHIADGDILIRVSACGVCGSDIHMWRAGKGWSKKEMPYFIMGHEFCGRVCDPGTSSFAEGDRVVF